MTILVETVLGIAVYALAALVGVCSATHVRRRAGRLNCLSGPTGLLAFQAAFVGLVMLVYGPTGVLCAWAVAVESSWLVLFIALPLGLCKLAHTAPTWIPSFDHVRLIRFQALGWTVLAVEMGITLIALGAPREYLLRLVAFVAVAWVPDYVIRSRVCREQLRRLEARLDRAGGSLKVAYVYATALPVFVVAMLGLHPIGITIDSYVTTHFSVWPLVFMQNWPTLVLAFLGVMITLLGLKKSEPLKSDRLMASYVCPLSTWLLVAALGPLVPQLTGFAIWGVLLMSIMAVVGIVTMYWEDGRQPA